ncbi:hypothetical protein LEP1GSC193_0445 [Leptospira alstonii serovar Pingchang str. 80-412]|uniref:Uncharacterized protein n=2 Tax=Leptospira alstonii TaxID=28452 RepID=M6CYD9_9LEPT|nr:hypothetical protein LEP1GSC194_1481 [Leptospira alstonii serovar Sichuan str. 79601]EQA79450.1 hypothetical protein LEP1GSC193_0445 [Leptospira alstonii serovar Pingchang str. 80-412]
MSSRSSCFIKIPSSAFLTSEFPGKNPETRFRFKKHFQNGFRPESCKTCNP